MVDETNADLMDADEYERRAEMGTGKSKTGATIRVAVIAACLLAAGGAIALNSGKSNEVTTAPQEQQFAATSPQQVEPQQLTPAPVPAPAERVAAADVPKSAPRPAARAPAAKPTTPAPVAPPEAVVTPPPATTIPEIAPAPSEIAPEATAPPAGAPVQ